MEGHFKVGLYDAGDVPEAVLQAAEREGRAGEYVRRMKLIRRAEGRNKVLDAFAGYTLYRVMSGPSVSPFNVSTGEGVCALATMNLCTYASDPTYEEWNSCDCHPDDGRGSIGAGLRGYKCIETEDYLDRLEIWKAPDGRQQIFFSDEFLWTQSIGNSATIRSIQVSSSEECNYLGTGAYQERQRLIVARIRLKDDRGRNVEFRKTDRMVLHLKWTFSMTAY